MNYEQARDIAISICYRLQPYCETGRLNIAGSVRRGKPEVKDIEICCVPKHIDVGVQDMFGGGIRKEVHSEFAHIVQSKLGKVVKGQPSGRYMQIALHQGINLDLFMPMPHDYFRQYAIRTGSADYSARVIAGGWVKKGWVGTEQGLRLQDECRRVAENKWQCTALNPTLPPVWESEQAFFEWLGVEWVKASERNV